MMYVRKMVLFMVAGCLLATGMLPTTASAEVYELRTYTTHDGKLDDLNARFRDHTVRLFTKHGMESVGYWVPTDGPEAKNTLIYVLRHKSRAAAKASWNAFLADPEWKKAAKASERDGAILSQAPEAVFMQATAYTPKTPKEDHQAEGIFELRIYRTNKGKLKDLDARFRDHTIEIFRRYQMESVAYWHPTDKPAAEDTLIYILRHESREAAKASWQGFVADPEWKKVAKESQKDGPFLRERPEAIYLQATDYSVLQ